MYLLLSVCPVCYAVRAVNGGAGSHGQQMTSVRCEERLLPFMTLAGDPKGERRIKACLGAKDSGW